MRAARLLLACALGGGVLAVPGTTAARERRVPASSSTLAIEINLGERVINLPPSRGYFDDLLGYGYGDVGSEARFAFELGVQASSQVLPWLQLGGGLNYVVTSIAARSGGGSIGIHAFEIDLARVRPVLRSNAFFGAVELSIGLQFPLTVYDRTADGHSPALLVRPRLMLGYDREGVGVGAMVGYAAAFAFADPEHHAAVALSGFCIGPWLAVEL